MIFYKIFGDFLTFHQLSLKIREKLEKTSENTFLIDFGGHEALFEWRNGENREKSEKTGDSS